MEPSSPLKKCLAGRWPTTATPDMVTVPPRAPARAATAGEPLTMHYPRRVSKIKRVRKLGFRARMRTRAGRKLINRKRREGRRVTAV